jgi:hypothetical protein
VKLLGTNNINMKNEKGKIDYKHAYMSLKLNTFTKAKSIIKVSISLKKRTKYAKKNHIKRKKEEFILGLC